MILLQSSLQQIVDSIPHSVDLSPLEIFEIKRLYEAVLHTEEYTSPWPWTHISIGLAMAAFIISLFSLKVAWDTFQSQKLTERNTCRRTIQSQIGQLIDLARHLYANFSVLQAIYNRLEADDVKYGKAPAREHFKKMHIDLDVIEPLYADDRDEVMRFHKLQLLCRNYNIEAEEASDTLHRAAIAPEVKEAELLKLINKTGVILDRVDDELHRLAVRVAADESTKRRKIDAEEEYAGLVRETGEAIRRESRANAVQKGQDKGVKPKLMGNPQWAFAKYFFPGSDGKPDYESFDRLLADNVATLLTPTAHGTQPIILRDFE